MKAKYLLLAALMLLGINSNAAASTDGYTKVLCLGNSITKHPIKEFWWGEWGMAATNPGDDWVHLLQAKLKRINPDCRCYAACIASPFEKGEHLTDLSKCLVSPTIKDKKIESIPLSEYDLVIIRLGENVDDKPHFQENTEALIASIRKECPNAEIVVSGMFWHASKRETALRNAAANSGCTFIELDHLGTKEYEEAKGNLVGGDDGKMHAIDHDGVAMHPSDKGMRAIADAIYGSLSKVPDSKSATLSPGESCTLGETYVRKNTVLQASMHFKEFKAATIGRGQTDKIYASAWVEIDKTSIKVYKHLHDDQLVKSIDHGLVIENNLYTTIDYAEGQEARLTLKSAGKEFSCDIPWWGGGTPAIENKGTCDMRTVLSFSAEDLSRDLWIIGDSYINWLGPTRWPYYIYNKGKRDWMADHLPGGASRRMFECFVNDLAMGGKPKIAVWAIGMNDKSDKDVVDPRWAEYAQKFVDECRKRGIEPVLTTTPSVPERNHTLKNQWVRNSGCRYVDFSAAVTDGDGNTWHEGTLYQDKVHPTEDGAKALAGAFQDFLDATPDIKPAYDRSRMPQPVFDECPGYVDLYWKAWDYAWEHVKYQPGLPQPLYMDEGLWDDTIWIWDSEFMAMYCKYAPDFFPGIQTLDNFYFTMLEKSGSPLRIQHPDNPPFYSWIEHDYYKFTQDKVHLDTLMNDRRFLQRYYHMFNGLDDQHQFNFTHVKVSLKNVDNIGFRWRGICSGMDNTPRERDKDILWVDALAQQAVSALYICRLAEKTGDKKTVREFKAEYERIRDTINKYYWDDAKGCYFDIREADHSLTSVVTPAAFWPMLAEIPSQEQAERMARFALSDNHLGGERPWKTVSREDEWYDPNTGRYWRGAVWLPTAYMGIKALEKYGLYDLADQTAEKVLAHQLRTYQNYIPHTIWECYNPEADKPAHTSSNKDVVRRDFCGWSALGPISLFIENVIGIHDVDAQNRTLQWDIHHEGRHGIKNLKFGKFCVDLVYDNGKVEVNSNGRFKLILNGSEYKIKKGTTTIQTAK